jgi:hypothetical protein
MSQVLRGRDPERMIPYEAVLTSFGYCYSATPQRAPPKGPPIAAPSPAPAIRMAGSIQGLERALLIVESLSRSEINALPLSRYHLGVGRAGNAWRSSVHVSSYHRCMVIQRSRFEKVIRSVRGADYRLGFAASALTESGKDMSVGIAGVFSGEVFLCAGLTGWAAGKRNSSLYTFSCVAGV